MRQVFISDLHLDPETPHVTEAFLRLLEREQTRCDALYILGDFTEVWVGDDDDSAFISHLKGALRLAGRHCKVHLMHGNRDFLIGEAFCRSAAIQLIDDPYVIEAGGRRGVLCHGDTLCSDDVAYQNVRKMFRSPEWQRDMLARGIDERRALAAALRAQSRSANANKAANHHGCRTGGGDCADERAPRRFHHPRPHAPTRDTPLAAGRSHRRTLCPRRLGALWLATEAR
ncbi:MAG: UDP-2,3-diacylglucosamine diphosphatase [Gammaproteobacteria bacterium]|nr:UDP-2,3-diacylglucosamine diphosphatase [Gammaproteobacteria bacterium]